MSRLAHGSDSNPMATPSARPAEARVDVVLRSAESSRIRTGLRAPDLVCRFKQAGTTSWRTKELTPYSFAEAGHGVYVIVFASEELDGAAPHLVSLEGRADLEEPIAPVLQSFTTAPASVHAQAGELPTTKLVGRVVGIDNKPIKATITVRPSPVGVPTQIVRGAAIGHQAVSVTPNEDGYFEIELVTGAAVQIAIPEIRLERNIVVPVAPAVGIPVSLFSL